MKRIVGSMVTVILLLLSVWAGSKGTAPRSAATKYPAHAEQAEMVSIGAKLLTSNEVRKIFVSNLNKCCVVVELAVFPSKAFAVSVDDISLRVAGTETATKPASATVISAALQKNARQERDITISPVSSIGYESGGVYDPATGNARRAGGVYTSAGVGVGIGGRGSNQPGASDKDRTVMETELSEKGLQEGTATNAVAGYVYFQLLPKSKNGKYQLQYVVNGNPMTLELR